MDPAVKNKLERDYDLDFDALVAEEAVATCRHCGNASGRGYFHIPFDAGLVTTEVRRAVNHAHRCAAVQRFVREGRHDRIGGRRRLAPVTGPPASRPPRCRGGGPSS